MPLHLHVNQKSDSDIYDGSKCMVCICLTLEKSTRERVSRCSHFGNHISDSFHFQNVSETLLGEHHTCLMKKDRFGNKNILRCRWEE